jgi:hypothetical protein
VLRVGRTGVVQQAKTDSEKRALLESATTKDLVLIAWPSQWSQEIYVRGRPESGPGRSPGEELSTG